MSASSYSKENKLEFRQIVLFHIKKILELSNHQLKDSSRQVLHLTHTEELIEEDTRIAYIQSIENLAIVLAPYFDDDMMEVYQKCINVINSYEYQLHKLFKIEIEEICSELSITKIPKDYFVNKKIEYSKKLFWELNMLLKRNDYLKSALHGDKDGDEVVEDIEEPSLEEPE